MKELLPNCRLRRWFLLGEGPGMLPSPILLLLVLGTHGTAGFLDVALVVNYIPCT